MKKIITIIIATLLLSSCSIDWNDEKDKEIAKQIIPEVSFKAHIIQFGGIHSALYDGVFWNIDSINSPSPMSDLSIYDIDSSGINIEYRGRKDFFTISCPDSFKITNCSINNLNVESFENKCNFYFPTEGNTNSDITFICNNGKLSTLFF